MRSGPAELLQFGHVHGVLEDVGHGALVIDDRRVGRTPETILDLAVAVLGPGHPTADEREDVRFPGREDTLEGLPQQRRALVARIVGIVRKRVEDILADQLFKASSRDVQIRVVGRDKAQLPIQDHVGIRRVLKESQEVHCGRHAQWSSLLPGSCELPVDRSEFSAASSRL
jgi:hypothetical protein